MHSQNDAAGSFNDSTPCGIRGQPRIGRAPETNVSATRQYDNQDTRLVKHCSDVQRNPKLVFNPNDLVYRSILNPRILTLDSASPLFFFTRKSLFIFHKIWGPLLQIWDSQSVQIPLRFTTWFLNKNLFETQSVIFSFSHQGAAFFNLRDPSQ